MLGDAGVSGAEGGDGGAGRQLGELEVEGGDLLPVFGEVVGDHGKIVLDGTASELEQ